MTLRDVVVLADGLTFLEGPRWNRGRLYFSDFYSHLVYSMDEDASPTPVCEVPGQPSGLGFDPAGNLLVASMRDRRLLRWDGRQLTEVADLSQHTSNNLNDMVVDADGRAYIGNFGSDVDSEPIRAAELFLVHPDGHVTTAARDLVFPNGTVISPDGRSLHVAESFAFRISTFDRASNGLLSGRRQWASFGSGPAATIDDVLSTDAITPDGLALDAEGALWVADAQGHGIPRVTEGGAIVDFIDTGDLAVFAATLGGADRRTLYLCAGPPLGTVDPAAERRACLLSCRVDVPGVGLP